MLRTENEQPDFISDSAYNSHLCRSQYRPLHHFTHGGWITACRALVRAAPLAPWVDYGLSSAVLWREVEPAFDRVNGSLEDGLPRDYIDLAFVFSPIGRPGLVSCRKGAVVSQPS